MDWLQQVPLKVKTLKFRSKCVFLQSAERVGGKQQLGVGCACVVCYLCWSLSHDPGAGGCSRGDNRGVSGSPAEPQLERAESRALPQGELVARCILRFHKHTHTHTQVHKHTQMPHRSAGGGFSSISLISWLLFSCYSRVAGGFLVCAICRDRICTLKCQIYHVWFSSSEK